MESLAFDWFSVGVATHTLYVIILSGSSSKWIEGVCMHQILSMVRVDNIPDHIVHNFVSLELLRNHSDISATRLFVGYIDRLWHFLRECTINFKRYFGGCRQTETNEIFAQNQWHWSTTHVRMCVNFRQYRQRIFYVAITNILYYYGLTVGLGHWTYLYGNYRLLLFILFYQFVQISLASTAFATVNSTFLIHDRFKLLTKIYRHTNLDQMIFCAFKELCDLIKLLDEYSGWNHILSLVHDSTLLLIRWYRWQQVHCHCLWTHCVVNLTLTQVNWNSPAKLPLYFPFYLSNRWIDAKKHSKHWIKIKVLRI